MKLVLTSLLLALITIAFSTVPLPEPGILRTSDGPISGVSDASGTISIYKGIPFAAPPVGDLRWKAPQPVHRWDQVRACTAFGPSPMQNDPVPVQHVDGRISYSEKAHQ